VPGDHARLNGLEATVEVRVGDLVAPATGEVFALLVTNPPQMPTPEYLESGGDEAIADDGGSDGWSVLRG